MGWIEKLAGAFRADGAGSNRPAPGDDFWYEVASAANAAGVKVTADSALKGAAVYACVRILAETMGSLKVRMYEELPDGSRVPAPNHPLDEVIRFAPNSWQTAAEFWEMIILHAALRGEGFAQIVPGARGAVDELWPLHSDRVRTEQLPNKMLRFQVNDPHTGKTQVLMQDEMFRIPSLTSDGIRGLKTIDQAAEAVALAMAADNYASRVFSNRLNMGGFISVPGKMDLESQKNFIGRLVEALAGLRNAHRPMLLTEGATFSKASMDAKDAQLLEARKWQVAEIARYFRIPLHMLNIDDQTNRSTVEAQALDFVKYTVRPWVNRIEQAIRRDLIVAKGRYVAKFNLEELLRGDSASRASYFGSALGESGRAAWMTPNEIRRIEGMNPLNDPRADLLGGMAMPEPAPLGNGNGGGAVAAIEHKPELSAAERLAGKETKANRKALERFAGDPDGWRDWVTAFYGGHVSFVSETLEIPKDAARAYCAFQRDRLLKANDPAAMLDTWEETLASEIDDTLERHAA